jgi:hypothetical protein
MKGKESKSQGEPKKAPLPSRVGNLQKKIPKLRKIKPGRGRKG